MKMSLLRSTIDSFHALICESDSNALLLLAVVD
jgi:hypothetical protein